MVGRPTSYKPEYCEMLEKHMASGLSFESFAGVIGVHRDSLYAWRDKFEEFSDSIKIGKSKALLFYEKLLLASTLGENKIVIDGTEKAINIKPIPLIFTMKNRFGWRDQPVEDNEKHESVTIEIK